MSKDNPEDVWRTLDELEQDPLSEAVSPEVAAQLDEALGRFELRVEAEIRAQAARRSRRRLALAGGVAAAAAAALLVARQGEPPSGLGSRGEGQIQIRHALDHEALFEEPGVPAVAQLSRRVGEELRPSALIIANPKHCDADPAPWQLLIYAVPEEQAPILLHAASFSWAIHWSGGRSWCGLEEQEAASPFPMPPTRLRIVYAVAPAPLDIPADATFEDPQGSRPSAPRASQSLTILPVE